jgi:hypothetical protein
MLDGLFFEHLFDLLHDSRMVMSHRNGDDAADKVDILVTLFVPYARSFSLSQTDRILIVRDFGRKDVLLPFLKQCLCIGLK